MLQFSPSIENIPDYPFAKVSRISKMVEQRDNTPVINARIGIPDIEAPRAIKESMAKYISKDGSTYGYPCDVHPPRGIPELIEAIIEDYRKRYGVVLTPDNIAVTGWTKEALHNLGRMFGQGRILIPDPVYPAYEGAAILSFHEIERIGTSKASNWLPEFNLEAKEGVVAFYFCDPNNPTGVVADTGYYQALYEGMKKQKICGIFDKAYKDFVLDDEITPVSITQVPGLMDYGFEVVSLSKHYNFVGVGLGWVVSSRDNIDRWLKFSGHYSQGVEWYKQKTGVEALTNPDVKAEMEEYYHELKVRRDILAKGLRDLGMQVEVPKATPYLWVGVPEGYDDEDFVLTRMIGEAHVAFMPGSYFGQSGRGYFRTTLYFSREKIEQVLDQIRKIRSW